MVPGEGGVLLLRCVELEERDDVKDVLAEECVEARLEERRACGAEFGGASGHDSEVAGGRTVFTLVVEGDRTLVTFLGSSVLRSGLNRCFGGVVGVNQLAYS